MLDSYSNYLDSKLENKELQNKYINYISSQKFYTVTGAAKLAIENNVQNQDPNQLLLEFYQKEATKANEEGRHFDDTRFSVPSLIKTIKSQEHAKQSMLEFLS